MTDAPLYELEGTARSHRRQVRPLLLVLATTILCYISATPLALLAIEGYQRFISPYKGFHCAHAAVHHGPSCSQYGKQAIAEQGLVSGLVMLRGRFGECSTAAETLRSGSCDGQPRAGACGESDEERGRREGKETKEYCAGCAKGCSD